MKAPAYRGTSMSTVGQVPAPCIAGKVHKEPSVPTRRSLRRSWVSHSQNMPPRDATGRPNNHPYAQKRDWPPGPNRDYLRDLQRPDNHMNRYRDKNSQSCCDAGDTVETKFKVAPGDGPYPEDQW